MRHRSFDLIFDVLNGFPFEKKQDGYSGKEDADEPVQGKGLEKTGGVLDDDSENAPDLKYGPGIWIEKDKS